MQETSLKAFADIKPTIGERQKAVLGVIQKYGDLNNNEIAAILELPINRITPRTNELVKMNYLTNKGRRKCPLTGKPSIIWGEVKETLW